MKKIVGIVFIALCSTIGILLCFHENKDFRPAMTVELPPEFKGLTYSELKAACWVTAKESFQTIYQENVLPADEERDIGLLLMFGASAIEADSDFNYTAIHRFYEARNRRSPETAENIANQAHYCSQLGARVWQSMSENQKAKITKDAYSVIEKEFPRWLLPEKGLSN